MRRSGAAAYRRGAAALGGAALLVLLSACGAPDPARRDIVLIVVDTLRADHLGAYGYPRDTSPAIDGMAARGVLFEAAWGAAPWTLPSIMSIMTSRYPSDHRVENDGLRLAEEIPTLAQLFAAAGYATGGFVSHIYVTGAFGFDRGFERYEDFDLAGPSYRLESGLEPDAARVTDAALAWLADQGNRPLLLFVHYFDPHWPYDPPEPARAMFPSDYGGELDAGYDSISRFQAAETVMPDDYRRFLIDRYDGEIRFVDGEIGRLLDGLESAGRRQRTWIVLTSDHGEEFKEHGSVGHGRSLYEEVIRVPLIIAGPDAAAPEARSAGAGRRIATPVSGIDILPTLIDLAGLERPPARLAGISLAPELRGEAADRSRSAAPDRPLVSETVRLNTYRKALRRNNRKLIHFMGQNRSELYDLGLDPLERNDLAPARAEECRDLLRDLYASVDVLSGAWNLTWSSDGAGRRFQGQISTSGIFRSIVPLFPDRGKYVIEEGNTLSFTDAGQKRDSGLAFTTAPYGAPVTFYLMIDGEPSPSAVALGARRAHPREMPFTLEGDPTSDLAFERPEYEPGGETGFFLWRTRPAPDGQAVTLDETIRERLRSLGYVD
jgi:arylsulfatase A-like enzyme